MKLDLLGMWKANYANKDPYKATLVEIEYRLLAAMLRLGMHKELANLGIVYTNLELGDRYKEEFFGRISRTALPIIRGKEAT